MPARILDGKSIGAQIRLEVAEEVKTLTKRKLRPGLVAVLVGNNPVSEVYVRNKVCACAEVGIYSEKITPPESVTTEGLLRIVEELNGRDEIDGILVQLPLPPQIDSKRILLAVSPSKDVDGFHAMNVGSLSTCGTGLIPCTPAGCMEILRRSNSPIDGREAVVVGRSNIVGKPVAMLLTNANATVTICHSHTRDLGEVCQRADILIAAIGKTAMIEPSMVRPGATVIDVGINRIDDQETFDHFFAGDAKREEHFASTGETLIGDVDPRVAEVAGAITPVPGGVGPLTIAILMSNTVKAAKARRGSRFGVRL